MPLLDEKLLPIYEEMLRRNAGETEFHQAVHEVLDSLGPRSDSTGYVVDEKGIDLGLLKTVKEIQLDRIAADAAALIGGGCRIVAEGANMPATPDAVKVPTDAGVLFAGQSRRGVRPPG